MLNIMDTTLCFYLFDSIDLSPANSTFKTTSNIYSPRQSSKPISGLFLAIIINLYDKFCSSFEYKTFYFLSSNFQLLVVILERSSYLFFFNFIPDRNVAIKQWSIVLFHCNVFMSLLTDQCIGSDATIYLLKLCNAITFSILVFECIAMICYHKEDIRYWYGIILYSLRFILMQIVLNSSAIRVLEAEFLFTIFS